jgi:hypothetical protein
MTIGIGDERLNCAIRSLLRPPQNLNATLGDVLGGLMRIVHFERQMVISGRRSIFRQSESGGTGFLVFEDQVNLCRTGLKPTSAEGESGPFDLVHSQHVDVELSAPFEILDDERNVIDALDP